MRRIFCLFVVMAALAADKSATLTVVVKDAATGGPVRDAFVTMSTSEWMLQNLPSGIFLFEEVHPGEHQITVTSLGRGVEQTRSVTVKPGETNVTVEFRFPPGSSIAGHVLDDNGDPLNEIRVYLFRSEYQGGVLMYDSVASATTGRDGSYVLRGDIRPGRSYLVMAEKGLLQTGVLSKAPADPKRRPPILKPTFYPDSKNLEGSLPVVVGISEAREKVDIRMSPTESYCVEGSVDRAGAFPDVSFALRAIQPFRVSGSWQMTTPGSFRLCDLVPGEYALSTPTGSAVVIVGNQDVTGIRISVAPPQRIMLEAEWDGDPPSGPPAKGFQLAFQERRGPSYPVSFPVPIRQLVPVRVGMGANTVDSFRFPKGMYAKSITVDGVPLQAGALPFTSGVVSTLRLVVANDGSFLRVLVTDSDDKPVPDTKIHIFPADEIAPAILAESRLSGWSTLDGTYTSETLRPGKYYVLATNSPVDNSPESLSRLWEARRRAVKVEVPAKSTVAVTVKLGKLD